MSNPGRLGLHDYGSMAEFGHSDYYYSNSYTVVGGVTDQELDFDAVLQAAGRPAVVSCCHYIEITSDVNNVTVKFNDTAATGIPLAAATKLTIPWHVMAIHKAYFSNSGACGAGNATLTILAL